MATNWLNWFVSQLFLKLCACLYAHLAHFYSCVWVCVVDIYLHNNCWMGASLRSMKNTTRTTTTWNCSGGVRGGSGEINHTSVFEYPHHPLPLFYALTHTLSCLLYSTLPATLALLLSLTLTYIRRFQHKHQQREAKRATLCKAITTTTTDHIKMRPKKIVTVSYDSSSHSNSKKKELTETIRKMQFIISKLLNAGIYDTHTHTLTRKCHCVCDVNAYPVIHYSCALPGCNWKCPSIARGI